MDTMFGILRNLIILFSFNIALYKCQTGSQQKYFAKCTTSNGVVTCATDQPSKVVPLNLNYIQPGGLGEDVLCAFKCRNDPMCMEFNFRTNNHTCELYYTIPASYKPQDSCIHFQVTKQ